MQEQLPLSIIVPIYNVEKFLRKCIESLEKQDIAQDRYEVILVNDGSTDRSGEICQELAGRYANIRVFNEENRGASTARNTGMDAAKGKYIMFVDPDDYIEPNVIGRVLDAAEKNNTELCFYLSENFDEHRTWGGVYYLFEHGKIYTGEYIMLHGMMAGSVWKNLFLTDFLRYSGVRFHEGIIHQDVDFSLMLYPLAHRILFTDILVYHYNCSLSFDSAVWNRNRQRHRKSLMSELEVANDIFHYCETAPISEALKRLYRRRMRSLLVSSILQFFKERQYYDRSFLYSFLDKANSYHLYPLRGCTESWKTTIMVPFVNLFCLVLGHKVKK